MAIFASKEGGKRNFEATEIETTIGPSVKVEGTFKGEGNVVIEGEMIGTFSTTKNLTVGQNARVRADVTADNMFVSGEIHGNLHVTGRVELTASAKIYGDIETDIISVAPGAILKGKCTTGKHQDTLSVSPTNIKEDERQRKFKK